MDKKRLLIIGGTGFIGRHLCVEAQRCGYAVTSLSLHEATDRLASIQYLVGDITRIPMRSGLNGKLEFEYIINAGGYIDHSSFWTEAGHQMVDVHLNGVKNLVALCDRSILKRFVDIGSSDVYGVAPAPQREDVREQPISPYSFASAAVCHLLEMLWRSEEFPAVAVRLFLAYGPNQGKERFLPQLIYGCLQNRSFPVSAGAQLRDFCYIDDVVNGILATLNASNICGEVINIASGNPISIRQMIERIRSFVGAGEPLFGRFPYRRGESMALYADITKAKSLLNWEPRVSLDEGLRVTVDWYKGKLHAS